MERILASIRKPNFMNAVNVNLGKYSCALDSFLEVWIHNCSEGGSSVLTNLARLKLHYDQLVTQNAPPISFHVLRDKIWQRVKQKCASFSPMHCNAQFSELFTVVFFEGLSVNQMKSLIINYSLRGYCQNCSVEA